MEIPIGLVYFRGKYGFFPLRPYYYAAIAKFRHLFYAQEGVVWCNNMRNNAHCMRKVARLLNF